MEAKPRKRSTFAGSSPQTTEMKLTQRQMDILKGIKKKEIRDGVSLVMKAAGELGDHKARVALILDVSASMESDHQFFSSGQVQKLLYNALYLAMTFDDNQAADFFTFGERAEYVGEVTVTNCEELVGKLIEDRGEEFLQGETNYAIAFARIRDHYFSSSSPVKSLGVQKADLPVFAIFVTDGDCNTAYKAAAEAQIVAASQQPIFWKILALQGKSKDALFGFIQSLDDLDTGDTPTLRGMDNVDTVILKQPEDLTNQDMLKEYRGYLLEAKKRNMVGPLGFIAEGMDSDDRKMAVSSHPAFPVSSYSPPVSSYSPPVSSYSSPSSTPSRPLPPSSPRDHEIQEAPPSGCCIIL